MRKIHKEQAENFIGLIASAHDEIKAALEKKNIPLALRLLSDCQEGAIALGDMIEKTAGNEGTKVITLLEEYCELLYQLHEQLSSEQLADGRMLNGKKGCKALHRFLINIRNGIKEIKVHREAVFLPYKASMWDSLESVWMAAEEDPDCDAYVIPIPYYDRNPDGSLGEIHYEINQYPDYVPVMQYDDYDFEKRRPDMIFIHNPYDEYNYVTSVPPFFYSKNLKQFTEKLVYIPYFVLDEVDMDNEQAVADVSKFCLLEGVVHADQVIVQSENMRQVYIRVLTKAMGERSRGYWEKKILGLGSPKVDKVLNTRKESLDIPEEWMQLICKPDGSWKKIIFYNTSVTALLQHSERMIAKIRDVFRIFYENREKVTLLWRPHPLIEATIKSMRPELWEEYRKLVEEYRARGWGIYDDSADLDRAVEICDVYYGDPSSVVWLCQAKKKPVIYQNIDVSIERGKLWVADALIYHDRLYILTSNTCSLFEYDMRSGKLNLCGVVGNYQNQCFTCMTVCGTKIYIAPYEADIVSVYDIEKRQFESIQLAHRAGKRKNKYYHMAFSFQKKVYFLGGLYSTMMCIDTESSIASEMSDWIGDFEKKYGCEAAISNTDTICIVDHCFWVALMKDNILLQYDMLTGEYCFWNVGSKQMEYATVNYDGNYFWLSGTEKAIVRWKMETNEIKEITDFPVNFKTREGKITEFFRSGHIWKGSIYYAPSDANMFVKLDLSTEQIHEIKDIESTQCCFNMVVLSEDEMYIYIGDRETSAFGDSCLIKGDDECRQYWLRFSVQDDLNINRIREIACMGEIIMENHPLCSLKLSQLLEDRDMVQDGTRGMVGKKIFGKVDM